MLADLRYALRGLWKTPGFSAIAIVVLALGVAVNIAIFSLVNAVFFRPLPVKAPAELTFVSAVDSRRPDVADQIDYNGFLQLKGRTDVFVDGTHVTRDSAGLVIDKVERRATGEMVTGNYFDVLGVPALVGRTLVAADDDGSAAPAMVISEALWRERFHSDAAVIGRSIDVVLDSHYGFFYRDETVSYTIVGVVASPFAGVGPAWSPVGYWVPSSKRINDYRDPEDERGWAIDKERWGRPILRRARGVSIGQAAAAVEQVGRAYRERLNPPSQTLVLVASDSPRVSLPFTGGARIVPERLAVAIMSIGALVLLIALSNLIGLFSARGVAQRGEVAIRLALGATRGNLLRYFAAQGLAIAVVSATLALALGAWAVALFSSTAPTELSQGPSRYAAADFRVPIDWHVLFFAASLPVVAALVIAASRARQAWSTDVRSAMQSGTPTTVAVHTLRMRYGVVVPQVAAALAILMVAGMFIRTVLVSELAEPGYDATAVSLIDFDMPQPPRAQFRQAADERRRINVKVAEFAATMGGVSTVSVTDNMNFVLQSNNSWVLTQEQFTDRSAMKWLGVVGATPGYFDTMGIRLLRGRDFDAHDERINDTAIVSAKTAAMLWPGQDPIGRRFTKTSLTFQHIGILSLEFHVDKLSRPLL